MSEAPWIDFQPNKEGLSKVLGDLEADIMRAIWKLEAANVKEIHGEVNLERKAAITTVATVLDRLYDKGLVDRELIKTGKLRYEYRPALTLGEFERTVVSNVFKGLFETFGESAVSYLVQNSGLEDEEALKALKNRLESLRRGKE